MTEYTNAIALALRLITKKGRTVILRRITNAVPIKAWEVGAPSNNDYNVSAVFLGRIIMNRDGELVKSENEGILIAASGLAITPIANDFIIDGSTIFTIVNAEHLKPGGEDVLFTLEVKK